MAINVPCGCGKTLKAKDTMAGKRVRCPNCAKIVIVRVPAASPPPQPRFVKQQVPAGPPPRPTHFEEEPVTELTEFLEDERRAPPFIRRKPSSKMLVPVIVGIAGGIVGMVVLIVGLFAIVNTPGGVGTRAVVNPTNVEQTKAWVHKKVPQMRKAVASGNNFQLQEVLSEANAELTNLEGREIRWKMPVDAVSSNAVTIDSYLIIRQETQRYRHNNRTWTEVTSETVLHIQPEIDRSNLSLMEHWKLMDQVISATPTRIVLTIGEDISPELARKVKKGDMITVSGVVTRTDVAVFRRRGPVDGRYDYRAIVRLESAKALE
jgi:DNA-directed RNA polymerase subunit RPC12/RpoP